MLVWEKRPIEIANLLNPAFCSMLIRDSIEGFHKEDRQGMPYSLSFLILPLILHKSTREALPSTIRTKLHVWLQNTQEARVNFVERARQLVPYTKESQFFGLREGIISINEYGNFLPVKRLFTRCSWANDLIETDSCRNKAYFLGRWLAKVGDVTTIFFMWGICP